MELTRPAVGATVGVTTLTATIGVIVVTSEIVGTIVSVIIGPHSVSKMMVKPLFALRPKTFTSPVPMYLKC